ncbi:MAG TPA: S53 family peptidase [Alloacidobacterium sp.]|nr:S53 family peptidase [Alloacidobacterium sp.]
MARFNRCLLIIALITSFVPAAFQAQSQSMMTHHVRQVTKNGQARSVGELPATQTLRVVITLPLRNQAELDNLLQELYDPNSPSYRHFLTVEEFTARFGPTQEDYDAVIDFAKTNGLSVVGTSLNRLNLDVSGPVTSVEKAFHVKMGVYQHPTENRTFYAPDREPTTDLPFQLWHVSGLDNYSIPHPAGLTRNNNASAKSNATTGSGPSASFLGSDMRAAYYGGTALTGSGQSLGLLEYYGTDLADLNTYFKNIGQTNNVPVTLLSTDGTSTSCVDTRAGGRCDDTEQTLDMTQAIGMAPGLSSLVMYVGSTDAAIFNAMATASPLNAQLSSSWTWSPADPNTDNPYFEEFAAQGQNLFQAAGDGSKWTTSGSSSEIYPADDVYVTSVGGTDLQTSSAAGPWSSETAWADGGGGISPDKFALPSWQTTAAAGCSSCSKSYRNGPDVSANANFTFYVCADQTTCTANEYGGTSFATPMWAGYLALANQQSVANGGKPLGFINPSLYAIGEGSNYDADFHDITSGSNGYSATTGYDLATGWGSPNGVSLINALVGSSSSSPSGFSLSASPTSISVDKGGSGSVTITTAVTGGFDSAITLSASGEGSGNSVTFSPSSITGAGTSTMTIKVGSRSVSGDHSITITGTSGSTTQTATVTLDVLTR